MQQLPDVLAQLVMQCLSLSELLRLARCNRRLFSQADSAFSFKHLPPVTRSWSVGCSTLGLCHLSRAPITLKPEINSASLTVLLTQLPPHRLYGFDATAANVFPNECVRLLSDPSMLSLRTLTLHPCFPWFRPEVLVAVTRLAALHTISLLQFPPTIELLRILALAPALTSISLLDTDFEPGSVLGGLVHFSCLKNLSVRQPWIYDEEWVAHFASPGLCKLTSLTLDCCGSFHPNGREPVNSDSAASVFTSLSQLTSLQLRMPFGVDNLLPSLHCAAALTSLCFEVNCLAKTAKVRMLPSFASLHALLIATPNLRIEIRLIDPACELREEYVSKLAAGFAGVAAEIRSRLTVDRKLLGI